MLDYTTHAESDARLGGGDQPSTPVLDPVTSEGLGCLIESESQCPSIIAVSIPANGKEGTQARTRSEDQAAPALLKFQKVLVMSESESQESAAMMVAVVKAEPGVSSKPGRKAVVQAQDSCTASSDGVTHQTRKRKRLGGVDAIDKENAQTLFQSGCTPATIKRICREKTGTDWQTVLDVTAYGEEQRIRRDRDTLAAAVTVEEKK
ncbi:hypothetical protein EDD22DRAFT_844361 [Suillus occidentalis]|nr:hypothetical protein EDD22DRAFT_844361 [Suillus occidentalis]